MNCRPLLRALPVVLLALPACGPFTYPAPEANEAIIVAEAAPFEPPEPGEPVVSCDGPAEQLSLLHEVCGATGLPSHGLTGQWGGRSSAGNLVLYVFGDPSMPAALSFAAFVDVDGELEPVAEGLVYPEHASADSCTAQFMATATFLWRETTIRVRWEIIRGC